MNSIRNIAYGGAFTKSNPFCSEDVLPENGGIS